MRHPSRSSAPIVGTLAHELGGHTGVVWESILVTRGCKIESSLGMALKSLRGEV